MSNSRPRTAAADRRRPAGQRLDAATDHLAQAVRDRQPQRRRRRCIEPSLAQQELDDLGHEERVAVADALDLFDGVGAARKRRSRS